MYALGIPKMHYRRTTQVLGPESADPISYEAHKQDDGFYLFSFPEIDEYDFEDIVILLKKNGITTIGADTQLTEKNIMKLTDLLKEQPSPDENNLIDILKDVLERWEKPEYRGGIDSCERSAHYFEDIKDVIEDYEEGSSQDAIAVGADDAKDFSMEEDKKKDHDGDGDIDSEDYLIAKDKAIKKSMKESKEEKRKLLIRAGIIK